MRVYLCEKPSQGQGIAEFLGMTPVHKKKGFYQKDNVCVTWAIGHLFDMQKPEYYQESLAKAWDLSLLPVVPEKFEYIIKDTHKGQFKVIKSLLKKATEVFIATDPDPEGERIARTIIKFSGYKGALYRVLYSSLDKKTLDKAFANPVSGQETEWMDVISNARAKSDWLVGMNLTMALTCVEKKFSHNNKGAFRTGRVKAIICYLVHKREIEIRNFKPRAFYRVLVTFLTKGGGEFEGEVILPDAFTEDGKLFNAQIANDLCNHIKDQKAGVVLSNVRDRKVKKPPLPYAQTTLQVAGERYGIPANETLATCQSLYAQPLTYQTYPRTGIRHLPSGMLVDAKVTLDNLTSVDQFSDYKPLIDVTRRSPAWNDKKVEVHHGIIPSPVKFDLSRLTEKQKVIFSLVAKRFLSQFAPDYEYDHCSIKVQIGNFVVSSTANIPVVQGWKSIESDVDDEDDGSGSSNNLPALAARDVVAIKDVRITESKTKAPGRYSTASLAAAMSNIANECKDNPDAAKRLQESDGIGTEATRSGLIDDSIKANLLLVKQGKLQPTERFEKIEPFIPLELKDPVMSAIWERGFEAIRNKQITEDAFLKMQSQYVAVAINKLREIERPRNTTATTRSTSRDLLKKIN
ncbi:hypothetical protein KW507_15960 [Vibrio fluvialis]|nr:hypothetical protein [Vibrio fluvialis]